MAYGDCNQVSQADQNEPEEGKPETNLEDESKEEKPKTKRRKLILLEYESEDIERETACSGSGDGTKLVENESEKKSKRKKKHRLRIDKKGRAVKKSKKSRSRIENKRQSLGNPYLADFDPNDPEFQKLVEESKILSLFPGAILDSSSSHYPHDIRNVPVLGFTYVYNEIKSESDSGSEIDLEKLDKLLHRCY